jgi:hypothetical protein
MATPQETAAALGAIMQQTSSRVDAIRTAVLQGVIPVEYAQFLLDNLTTNLAGIFDPIPTWIHP